MLKANIQKKQRSINKLQLPTSCASLEAFTGNFVRQSNIQQIKQINNQQPKIVKINQLIHKKICLTKQINLTDMSQVQRRSSRKTKLDISLSRQKLERQRSISERSANKSTKIKVSIGRHESIRKIKSFETTQQDQQNFQKAKNHRAIQSLQIPKNNKQNTNNIINIGNDSKLPAQVEKRKIKIYRK